MSKDVNRIPNNIAEARRSYAMVLPDGKFTQEDAAKAFGVALSTYRNWEQGIGRGLFGEQLADIAKLYGVTVDYLLCLADAPARDNKEVDALTADERRLLAAYRASSTTARAAILASAEAIQGSIGEGVGAFRIDGKVGA